MTRDEWTIARAMRAAGKAAVAKAKAEGEINEEMESDIFTQAAIEECRRIGRLGKPKRRNRPFGFRN